ncbi:MAG: hypothetical protein KF861_11680 [Planctomycetaceae bacterium]|nr:hypothetical protein [Planctomycetaceae bacterium]
MPTLRAIVDRMFTHPGGPPEKSDLIAPAAKAHRHLFQRECQNNSQLCAAVPLLRKRIHGRIDCRLRKQLLCHPGFVEALHRLSLSCPQTQAWHAAVASPSMIDSVVDVRHDCRCLGAIELALRILDRSDWDQTLPISSDLFGRVPFALCDWTVTLRSTVPSDDSVLAEEPVDVRADRNWIRWQWSGDDGPFLSMPRDACRSLIADNPGCLDVSDWSYGSGRIAPHLGRAVPLCQQGVRYERVHIADAAHAGGIEFVIRALHDALHNNSPSIHRELCAYISTIRGFELRLPTAGTVQSFSDPSSPGVMSVNVPYDDRDEPRISPLCFTWLAHELAHTKFYMINDIAFDHGWVFVRNGAEMTDVIPRYARRLPIRTLFQVPYTHLYEWESLMDFLEADFAGLPWAIDEDPQACGEDLKCEIEEALSLTDEFASLTPLGAAAFSRFEELFTHARSRWRRLTATPQESPTRGPITPLPGA